MTMPHRETLGKYNLTAKRQARFWSFVDKQPAGCWNWTGSVNSERSTGGYGKFLANGYHLRAHIYAWTIFNGIPPKGMVIAHSCDNRRCVNPAHLRVTTHRDNVAEMYARGRAHKLCHFSERQLVMLAERLNVQPSDMLDAAQWLEQQPTVRWPKGKPRKQVPR